MDVINVAGLVEESIVDGPGMRFVVFVQGCPHHCKGCHNPDTHPFGVGTDLSVDEIYQKIRQNPLVHGVTFSGGEPFSQAGSLAKLGQMLRQSGYDLFVYSGFTLQQLLEKARTEADTRALLTVGNYLVDGPYLETERDLTLKFRGSRNQKIYDITCYPNSERIYEVEKI